MTYLPSNFVLISQLYSLGELLAKSPADTNIRTAVGITGSSIPKTPSKRKNHAQIMARILRYLFDIVFDLVSIQSLLEKTNIIKRKTEHFIQIIDFTLANLSWIDNKNGCKDNSLGNIKQ
jgi:hypothetical protein